MMHRVGRVRAEEGNALLLALLFVVVFGILLGAILQFSGAGIETAQHISDVRDVQHAVDGAVQGAINSLRTASPYGGCVPDGSGGCTSTVPCPDFTSPNATGDPVVVVTCQPVAVSGTPAPPTDIPNWAILTVGTAAGEGLHTVMTGSDSNLQVNGGIFSYGDLKVTGTRARISVIGRAVGKAQVSTATCDAASVFASVPVVCGTTNPAQNGADAASYNYPHQAMTLPSAPPPNPGGLLVDPVPTCPGPTGMATAVVNFAPGLYTVLPKYLFAKSGCGGDVWWFSPGTYYFRFPDADALWQTVDGPVKASVIGGTPTSAWNGNSDSSVVDALLATGADGCLKGSPGVQFIMGGRSRIATPGNNYYLHLCAKDGSGSPPTSQQIAMYGVRPSTCSCLGAETSGTVVPGQTLAPSSIAITTTGAPAPSPNSTSIPSTITLNKNPSANRTATVAIGAFDDIPEGSTITSLFVRVKRNKSDPSISETLSLTLASNGTTVSCDLSPAVNDVAYTCPTDYASSLGQSNLPKWRDINSMTASLALSRGSSGAANMTYQLSNVDLVATYTTPRFEKTTVPSGSYLLDANNSNPTVKLFGTLFAPDSAINVLLHNKGDSVFHRGVIVRTIDAKVISSSTQNDAPFQLPSSNASREVILIAHLSSSSGTVRLRARVQFVDVNDGGTADPTDDIGVPGYKVRVLNWQYVRG